MSRLRYCPVQSLGNSGILLVVQSRTKANLAYQLKQKLPSARASLDHDFLDKVMEIIDLYLGDDTFSIDTFSREVGVSRVQLYRRVKAHNGLSPNQLLRTTRIKRSAALMQEQRISVSEVAYRVGFSSLSYFAKCFKSKFGFSPSQFRRQVLSK